MHTRRYLNFEIYLYFFRKYEENGEVLGIWTRKDGEWENFNFFFLIVEINLISDFHYR